MLFGGKEFGLYMSGERGMNANESELSIMIAALGNGYVRRAMKAIGRIIAPKNVQVQ